ncbi:MAG: peptidoglycan D,D-transpeptidase FtsI family protein [Candidatus Altimarinota bacterium]
MVRRSLHTQRRWYVDRISILKYFILFFFVIIVARLFQLQVLSYEEYSSYAEQRMKDKVISARRGRILLQDGKNGFFELANNVSLELLFADPYLLQERIKEKEKTMSTNPERAAKMHTPGPAEVAQLLGPLLFQMVLERSTSCDGDAFCINQAIDNAFFAQKRYEEQEEYKRQQLLNPEFKIPETPIRSQEDLLREYIGDLTSSLSKTQRDFVTLKLNLGTETIKKIQDLNLTGIGTGNTTAWANPQQVVDIPGTAKLLEPFLEIPAVDLEYLLSPRPNRYVKIMNRIDFETAKKIRDLNITGLGFYEEHWRNYAEQEDHPFAPQVIGFLDNAFNPIYGVEKSMNDVLAGTTGHIRGEVDLKGRTLTARTSSIEQAINGKDVVLTIDQVIQNKVEELLEEQVKASRARSGEVIVQDPYTGAILAMATYPGFNPNEPGGVYEKEPIELTQAQIENLEVIQTEEETRSFLYLNPGYKIEIFKQGEDKYLRYKNKEGIKVYRNSTVSDIYEPGSVFKAIVMASAIDSKEVRPSDIFHDTAPLKVDCHFVGSGDSRREVCDYTIKNSTNNYYGAVTMTQILEKSLNTGMAHVSKKLGPSLLYDYLKNFGFGEKTFIELPEEHSGKLTHYRNWVSESEMITKAFGQGIAATPIQMVTAFSSIVNGGLLMQPTIIAGTINEDGEFEKNEAKTVRRVITSGSSEVIKSMLVSVVRHYSQASQIPGYKIGGKTGTSQIATGGLYEKGEGSTIASFAGFAPYDRPRFVMLVKIDRPLGSPWGETNAVPLFKKISTFLFNYLQIPPDDLDEPAPSRAPSGPVELQ